jgi:sugar phosphate isomerase/epimerase
MNGSLPRLGLMLYTLRDECERDLEGTIRKVAALGYEGVEFWQLHGHEPDEVRGWLDETGLVAVGRHAGFAELERDLPQFAEELRVLGSDRLALAFVVPKRRLVRRIARIAESARDLGLRLGFHNHGAELRRLGFGGTFLDRLRELRPEVLWLELDLGWVWHAGADPVAELRKTSGRCPLLHVKDFRSRQGRDEVPVGDGAVGYERVLPAAVAAEAEWLLVEQDHVEGPAFEAVERSLRAVQRILQAPPAGPPAAS